MSDDGRVKPEADLTKEYKQILAYRDGTEGSPKVRLAAKLYASGAVPTKRDAAKAAGISEQYFAQMSGPRGAPAIRKVMATIEDAITDKTVDMGHVIQKLGRESIKTINDIRVGSESEMMQFKAAQDLADRSPEVSKTQKHLVASLTLEGKDVESLAQALVEGKRVAEDYAQVAQDGYVGVELEMKEVPTQFKHLSMGEEGNERYATDQEDGAGTESFGGSGEHEDKGEAIPPAAEENDSGADPEA